MSKIQNYLDKIQSAVYGKDVRSAIYNAIKQCYDDVTNPTLNSDAIKEAVQTKIDDGTLPNMVLEDGSVTESKISDVAVTPAKTTFIKGGRIKLEKIRNDSAIVARFFVKVKAGETLYWSGTAPSVSGVQAEYTPSSLSVYSDIDAKKTLKRYTFTFPYPKSQTFDVDGYVAFDGVLLSKIQSGQLESYFDNVIVSNMLIDDSLDSDQEWLLSFPDNGWKSIAKQLMPASFDLCGATWMQIGDSLTALESGSGGTGANSKGFGQVIAQKYGCNFINNGTFGATWAIRNNSEYDAFCAVTRINEIIAMENPPDYLTIALGTNDRTNGTFENTKNDTNTLYGAVRYCLETLKTNIPHLRLGVILEPQRSSGNADLAVRNEIIKEVCKEYSVPVCDMYYESGIVPSMLSDGLHLTSQTTFKDNMPTCRWLFMKKLESFLLSL